MKTRWSNEMRDSKQGLFSRCLSLLNTENWILNTVFLLTLLLLAGVARADIVTWTGGSSADWATEANKVKHPFRPDARRLARTLALHNMKRNWRLRLFWGARLPASRDRRQRLT